MCIRDRLYTVNAEYNAKLVLVSALNDDLDGMSQATGIATVFVDEALTLVRFTPEAMALFRLRPADVGRPLTDFNVRLDYPELTQDLRRALAGGGPVERTVQAADQSRYLARVIGYGRVGARRAVLSLIDVSRLHDAERLQRLIDSLPEHVALLDRNGTLQQVNLAWTEFARCNGGQAASTGVGSNYLSALARSNDPGAMALLQGLQQVLDGSRPHLRRTYPCHGPDGERWFVLHASPLAGVDADADRGAVVTHLEVTPWVQGTAPAPDPLSEDNDA